MQATIPRLRDKLANDPSYFTSVYNHTFELAKTSGQRSLRTEFAIAFWELLIPHGLSGTALAHTSDGDTDDDEDTPMDTEGGWKPDFTKWWFEFLTQKGSKGISRDTWTMVRLDIVLSLFSLTLSRPPSAHSSSTSSEPSARIFRTTITKAHGLPLSMILSPM